MDTVNGREQRAAVSRLGEDNLQAEAGQSLLVVADQMLAVALVAPLVVVGAGVHVVAVVAHDRPGDAQQGVGDGDRGLFLVALAEPAGQAAEPGAGAGGGAGGGPG
jgi:hypothetical protein